MALKDYRAFIILGIIIFLIIIGVWVYRQIRSPYDLIEEQNQTIQQLQEENLQLKSNTTGVEGPEQRTSVWTFILFLSTILLLGYVLYLRLVKPSRDMKNRHEIIESMRKYGKEKDGYTFHRVVKFVAGYYKSDHKFPLALVLFTTIPSWRHNIEPPSYTIYGYLVNMIDLDDVREDFSGLSIKEVENRIKLLGYGMRLFHYFPYQLPSYKQEAIIRGAGYRAEIDREVEKEIEVRRAVEEVL